MSDEQVPFGNQEPAQLINQLLLGGSIEIDHDIPTEDNLKRLPMGIRRNKVALPKVDAL